MRKRNYITVGVFALFAVTGLVSCVVHDNDYYNTNPNQNGYSYSFNEDFYSDNRGWAFDDPADSAFGLVANGYYKMVDYSRLGTNHVAVVSTGVRTAGDFLIQTRMKSDYSMGLIFGASSNSYGYSIFLDNSGYFAVYKEGLHPQAIVSWQYDPNIRQGWNDVEVEQVSDYWYFYINGVKVYQTPARPLSGSQTGFMVLANTTGYVDYLTLKW